MKTFEDMFGYKRPVDIFREEIKSKIGGKDGTRISNALARMGITSMEELKDFLKEHKFGEKGYWSGIGEVGYWKLVNAIYLEEEP